MDLKITFSSALDGFATFRGHQCPGQWIVFDRDRTDRVRDAEDILFRAQTDDACWAWIVDREEAAALANETGGRNG